MNDFAVLYGKYGEVEFPNKKFELTEGCFASVVARVSEEAEASYGLAGLDVEKIGSMEKYRQSELKDACSKPELLPFAKSAYVFFKLKQRGVTPIPKADGECKSEKFEGSGIGLMVKFKDWIFIKKLGKGAEGYEVAGLLATANERFLEKMFKYLLGREVTESRKATNLDKVVDELAEAYESSYFKYLEMALSYKGFRPYPFLKALVKAYPELKPKKPRGRLPK